MFWSQKQLKIKTMFIYFWLNHCGENLIKKTPIAVENIDHLFRLASAIIEADRLHLFLLSYGTRIDEDEYLSSLEGRYSINYLHGGTNPKIFYLFWIEKILEPQKHLLSVKYWLFFMTPDNFPVGCFFKNNFDVIEALQALFKVFFNGFCIWLWTSQKSSKRVSSR